MISSFQDHVQKWENCERCPLCKTRQRVVLARGKLPCAILFVGEAPGDAENSIGQPFVGPAGHELNRILRRALPGHIIVGPGVEETWVSDVPYAITNLVACLPVDPWGDKSEPYDESIVACAPRLQEFIRIADGLSIDGGNGISLRKPGKAVGPDRLKLIVCVGKLAREWLTPGYKHSIKLHREIPQISIDHPAYLLRLNHAQRGLATRRAIVTLANATERLA